MGFPELNKKVQVQCVCVCSLLTWVTSIPVGFNPNHTAQLVGSLLLSVTTQSRSLTSDTARNTHQKAWLKSRWFALFFSIWLSFFLVLLKKRSISSTVCFVFHTKWTKEKQQWKNHCPYFLHLSRRRLASDLCLDPSAEKRPYKNTIQGIELYTFEITPHTNAYIQ